MVDVVGGYEQGIFVQGVGQDIYYCGINCCFFIQANYYKQDIQGVDGCVSEDMFEVIFLKSFQGVLGYGQCFGSVEQMVLECGFLK